MLACFARVAILYATYISQLYKFYVTHFILGLYIDVLGDDIDVLGHYKFVMAKYINVWAQYLACIGP